MLKFKLLNEQATLNNFNYVETVEYIPTLPFSLKIQILNGETKNRVIPGAAAKLNAIFQKRDGTEQVIAGDLLVGEDDRSMWEIDISAAQAVEIVGGNVRFDLDFDGDSTVDDLSDASDLRSGMAYSILAKITFDGDC